MNKLTPEQLAELEAYGAALADKIERDDYPVGTVYEAGGEPPEIALKMLSLQRAAMIYQLDKQMQDAVDKARAEGLSWHKIALPLGMTAEGARRRFAPA